MSLTSFNFILFVFCVAAVYFLLPQRVKWLWLLAASGFFFVTACDLRPLAFLGCDVLIAYFGARAIERSSNERGRKIAVAITVALILSMLFVLKTLNGILIDIDTASRLLGRPFNLNLIELAAPIGLSYLTLTLTGYVVDVYREECSAQKNPLKLMLFACFFPQMTAGPIVRYSQMSRELFVPKAFDPNALLFGLERMLWGFFKKLVIADRLAISVSLYFSRPTDYSGLGVVYVILICAFQLYADFSGLMDIVIGASQCMRIELPENFDVPFSAQTVTEFFRRWHMTLGLWFKDYLLYPLLKSNPVRKLAKSIQIKRGAAASKKLPTYIGLVVVWFFVGLWHSAEFVDLLASGALPCLYILTSELFGAILKKATKLLRIRTDCFSYRLFGQIRTFALLSVCFFISRCGGLSQCSLVFRQLFAQTSVPVTVDGSFLCLGLFDYDLALVAVGLLIMLTVDILHFRGVQIRVNLAQQNLAFRWIVLMAAIFAVLIFGVYGPGFNPVDFIYAGF